jgi:hypothetical protein
MPGLSFAIVTRSLPHTLRQRRMSGATGASADVPPPPFLFQGQGGWKPVLRPQDGLPSLRTGAAWSRGARWCAAPNPYSTRACSLGSGARDGGNRRRVPPPARTASETHALRTSGFLRPSACGRRRGNAVPPSSPRVIRVLDLQPGEAPARPVAGVPAFGDDAQCERTGGRPKFFNDPLTNLHQL